jgi:hypothetical protein
MVAVSAAALVAGCGASAPSRIQLARASARKISVEFAAARPFSTPREPRSAADRAKLALLENIQARSGLVALPKAYDYCVAYRAGIDYPAAGLARLSRPASPYETFAFGARLYVKGVKRSREPTMASVLGFSAGFQRVEKHLATECDEEDAATLRPEVVRQLKADEEQVAVATGRLPGYAACAFRRIDAFLTGRELVRSLTVSFLRPQAGVAIGLETGYRFGVGCLIKGAAAAAFRSSAVAVAARGLVRDGVPAALVSCFSAGLRADLSTTGIRSLFRLPASTFQHLAAKLSRLSYDQVLADLRADITSVLRDRAKALGKTAALACSGQHV